MEIKAKKLQAKVQHYLLLSEADSLGLFVPLKK